MGQPRWARTRWRNCALCPTDKILHAAEDRGGPRFSPVVDGRLLTEPVAETYAAGQASPRAAAGRLEPRREQLAANGMTAEKWKAFAAEHFGDRAAEFLKLYPGDTDEQALRSAIDYGSDAFIAFGTWKWIEAQREDRRCRRSIAITSNWPRRPASFIRAAFAFHSDDIEYVFGTLDTRPAPRGGPRSQAERRDDELLDQLRQDRRPQWPGLPEWPKYDKEIRDSSGQRDHPGPTRCGRGMSWSEHAASAARLQLSCVRKKDEGSAHVCVSLSHPRLLRHPNVYAQK